MGCKSPVGVPTWTHHESKDNHEPKARAIPRGHVWRKPECKSCEATDRNRIVKAEGCEASWHMTAKPSGTQPTVNAALVHRQFAFLPGEICAEGGAFDDDRPGIGPHREPKVQALRRAARCMRRIGSNHHRRHS